MLHSDAKRLFAGEGEEDWQTEYELRKYKSLKQAGRHAVRDGTAFASVALPAHYAAIYSVLSHVKQRLEPDWKVTKIIDWGAGTGSGLWFELRDTCVVVLFILLLQGIRVCIPKPTKCRERHLRRKSAACAFKCGSIH